MSWFLIRLCGINYQNIFKPVSSPGRLFFLGFARLCFLADNSENCQKQQQFLNLKSGPSQTCRSDGAFQSFQAIFLQTFRLYEAFSNNYLFKAPSERYVCSKKHQNIIESSVGAKRFYTTTTRIENCCKNKVWQFKYLKNRLLKD